MTSRDKRLLIWFVSAMVLALAVRFGIPDRSAPVAAVSGQTARLAQKRLERLRQIAATVPAREADAKQAAQDLAIREKGILQAATAAQAQARLLEVARTLGKAEQIDVRGGDFGAPKSFGDYGLVYTTVSFDCHVEQLVNFLAALSRQPELIMPSEERINASNGKEKFLNVRMVLSGVVPKKLVPEKKGLQF